MKWHERLNKRRKELDLSWAELSRMTGIHVDNFYKYNAGKVDNPRGDTVRKIADALGTTELWLIHELTANKQHKSDKIPSTLANMTSIESMQKDLPVLGTASGSLGEGSFQINDDPIDFVRRPPAVLGVEGAYAIYVIGNSMEPVFEEKDLCIVHPGRPISIGDRVIIQMQNHEYDDIQAYIKELVRHSATSIFCKQYNPLATIEFKLKFVKSMHKVLNMNDLFGV